MPYKNRARQLQYWLDYQKEHRKRASQNCLNSYYVLRKLVFKILGNECVCCGMVDDLTVDHIKNPSGTYRKSNAWDNFREVRDTPNPMQIFQTLCRRCNRSKANTPACRLQH